MPIIPTHPRLATYSASPVSIPGLSGSSSPAPHEPPAKRARLESVEDAGAKASDGASSAAAPPSPLPGAETSEAHALGGAVTPPPSDDAAADGEDAATSPSYSPPADAAPSADDNAVAQDEDAAPSSSLLDAAYSPPADAAPAQGLDAAAATVDSDSDSDSDDDAATVARKTPRPSNTPKISGD